MNVALKTTAMTALILASGCIIGASAASMARQSPATSAVDAVPTGAETSRAIVDRLRSRLSLTDAQVEALRRAFNARVESIASIRADLGRQLAAEQSTLDRELRSTLTPEQYEQWRQVLDDFRNSRRRRGAGLLNRGS
jgi:hypothetical protein